MNMDEDIMAVKQEQIIAFHDQGNSNILCCCKKDEPHNEALKFKLMILDEGSAYNRKIRDTKLFERRREG